MKYSGEPSRPSLLGLTLGRRDFAPVGTLNDVLFESCSSPNARSGSCGSFGLCLSCGPTPTPIPRGNPSFNSNSSSRLRFKFEPSSARPGRGKQGQDRLMRSMQGLEKGGVGLAELGERAGRRRGPGGAGGPRICTLVAKGPIHCAPWEKGRWLGLIGPSVAEALEKTWVR